MCFADYGIISIHGQVARPSCAKGIEDYRKQLIRYRSALALEERCRSAAEQRQGQIHLICS